MRRTAVLLLLALLSGFCPLPAQQRVAYTVNEAWHFSKEGEKQTIVNIPHTWNAQDADDDEPGFYRGAATYSKSIFIPAAMSGKYVDIYFEGANQEVRLYVNGALAGEHKGGYTAFNFEIWPYLKFGEYNDFEIRISNRHNPDIPPLSADYTFFGGIYRDVYLRHMNPVHFSASDYASSGIYISTPSVSSSSAEVEVRALLDNLSAAKTSLVVETGIYDAEGHSVTSKRTALKLGAGERKHELTTTLQLANPVLWNVDNPYLYSVCARIFDKKTGALLDELSQPLGVRWYSFDPEEGFFLNGKHLKLVGTARHQDFYRLGYAIGDEYHVQDIRLLKDMGGNFLRVSHYPQDPVILEMCDRLGIITSVEIPVINAVTETQAFLDNSVEMAVEMVRQSYNHPSVVIWGYMNEIFLRQPYDEGEKLDEYYKFTEDVARAIESRIREEDSLRYTMMAFHNAPQRYEKARLTEIPMILGWNLYQGWYEPDINEFQRLLDRAHKQYKGKILMVTEYGPGVDPRVHSYTPERFDFSQEYGLIYHKHYMEEMARRPFIAGSSLWNLNDFYSEPRVDAVAHVNDKGITGLDREIKDVYLMYKALLSDKPFIAIGNREWKSRAGAETSEGRCIQPVPVFSNAPSVSMTANGASLGLKKTDGGIAYFDVPFIGGKNVLEVSGYVGDTLVSDRLDIGFELVRQNFDDFIQINVMLGSPRYYDDRSGGLAWIPEQEYRPGSWGYIGGHPYRRPTSFGALLGSDINILGTDDNPVFQTQRVGLDAFKADVPSGEYAVYLYFAELDNDIRRETLVYNLGAETETESGQERIFNVSVNGTKVLDNFNIAAQCGAARAVIKKVIVNVPDDAGLTVSFDKVSGEPVLNALRILKIR